ncbi:MAG: TonB-dependent receptor plug domain-containing protein [Vicinamibacterales bacterium]
MIARVLAAALVWAVAAPVAAQTGQAGGQPPAPQQEPQKPQEPTPEEPIVYEEQVIVSASRVEQRLVNAPAAVSLVTSETIQNSPAVHIGDLLRAVPGLNVSQTSARDVNITTRGATSTLSTSQLALVDGRSVYLDFFGMVMWDLIPSNPTDIKQIEVIRGPASAVWGANAMSGVVNVITKSPRELAAQGGTSVTIGIGAFDRTVPGRDDDAGALFYVNGAHAQAVNDRWAFKISAGYLSQDPMPRPTGTIPNRFNTPYPPFTNEGTSQPKFDARADYDYEDGARLIFAGGVAGTEGIIHSGIGPFDISSDSRMSYFTARYQKAGRRIAFFTNLLNGDAANLLTRGANGLPLPLIFDTKTFDVDASDVRAWGTRHVFSFGGNFRHNAFDISLAPDGDDRNEGGAYLQDEIFLSDHFRWVIGGRIDKFSSIDDPVFSPRTTFMVKPSASQTFRVSYNRAFRAPSFINNHISTTIINQLNLGAINPLLAGRVFNFPLRAVGNPDLKQETLTAFELGYTGVVNNRATVTAAVYWNETEDAINFAQSQRYGALNPPPGWPLPPIVLEALAAAGSPLPSQFTYVNLGTFRDKGVELGVDAAVNQYLNVFANYSYQWDPDPQTPNFNIAELNLPPNNRFNAGFNFSYGRFLGNLSANYTDEAFWQDVLDSRFHGTTDAYTLVNAGVGVRWAGDRLVTSLKVNNLANEEVLQHIFGDVMKRQVVGELRVTF